MRRRSGWLVGVAALVAALVACAGGQKRATAPEIDPDWLARVPPEGMAAVEAARAARQEQEDEVGRSSVAREDAENQVEVAKNEERAAKAAVDAAESRVDGAKARGQYTEINEAKAALDHARLAQKAAEAKRQRDEKAVELAKAQETLAKAQLDTAGARVSQAEYRALLASGDTRAANLNPADFEAAVTANLAQEERAQADVSRHQQGYQAANAKYDQLQQQLQATEQHPTPAG